MKILFLHLSDIHISDTEREEKAKIKKLVESLNVINGFDECLIVVSGDLTSEGKINEFKKINKIFGELICCIRDVHLKDKFINILVVPGNHDIALNKSDRTGNDIREYYKENRIDEMIEQEFNKLDNFFNFSKSKRCFSFSKFSDRKFIALGDYKIQANLINTTLFSTLEPDDKELHYFPKEEISYLEKKETADIVITIMHHTTEWFHWISKKDLENSIYKNTSILFTGHDHSMSIKDININNKDDIFISAGGELSLNANKSNSEFNAIILDSCLNTVDVFTFTWNYQAQIYQHQKLFENKKINLKSNLHYPNAYFINIIRQDDKQKLSSDFTQYFVFPELIYKPQNKYEDKIEVSYMQDFKNIINEKKYLNIVGGDNSGKTTLLKRLFLELLCNKVSIFLNSDNIRGKNIDKLVKDSFEEQYSSDPTELERFLQLHKDYKVVLIDDFDLIKSDKIRNKLIEELKNLFGYIIVTTKDNKEFDIISRVKGEIETENKFYQYNICDFYLSKRQDLIKQVCMVTNPEKEDEIEKIISTINGIIRYQLTLFNLNPDFIIQYTKFFLQDSGYQIKKNDSIFNKVFETNLYNSIIRVTDKEDVDVIITTIEEIAYYFHFNKKEALSFSEIENVVKNYNENYSEKVKVIDLIEIALKAKIFKQINNTLKFSNKNHLAFFVAKALSRHIFIDNEGTLCDIKYILKNICFSINDNIILFLSYLTNNPQIIMLIHSYAADLMSEWTELDLDNNNIKFITSSNSIPEVKAPKADAKQKSDYIQDKREREIKEDEVIECSNIYDYDENEADSFENQILRALKYTEMISKALPNFHNILTKNFKSELTNGIYRFPNKILYYLLCKIDENFDTIVSKIKELADELNAKNELDETLSIDEIKEMFQTQAICVILSMYNRFAFLATDSKSISVLESHELRNSNDLILNLMISENFGHTEIFEKKADLITKKNNNAIIDNMVARIVRKHLIYTYNIKPNIKQRIIDNYFGKKERKKYLIASYTKKIK